MRAQEGDRCPELAALEMIVELVAERGKDA
jgi:hypothetical protein